MRASMAKLPLSSRGRFQHILTAKNGLRYLGQDDLRNSHPRSHDERQFAVIDHDDQKLSPIICIDCSGSVEDRDLIFYRKATARAHLDFISMGNLESEARGNDLGFPWLDYDI